MPVKCFYLLLFIFMFSAGLYSCKTGSSKHSAYVVNIEDTKLLATLASGSGILLQDKYAFIISDNANGYYIIDTTNYSQRFYPFNNADSFAVKNKNIKEDFENASTVWLDGKKYLLSFGSGSVETTRENILKISIDSPGKHTIIPAAKFYQSIKSAIGINTTLLNLEASFSTADSFYLLNRGTNHLIAMDMQTLQKSLKGEKIEMHSLKARSFSLPLVDSFPIAFSGACYYKDNQFLFTATVEKTNNWFDDGEIAGSYIGMADVDGHILFLLPIKDKAGEIIKEKLESLDIIGEDSQGNISLFAVADNDNGKSTWLRLRLKKP